MGRTCGRACGRDRSSVGLESQVCVGVDARNKAEPDNDGKVSQLPPAQAASSGMQRPLLPADPRLGFLTDSAEVSSKMLVSEPNIPTDPHTGNLSPEVGVNPSNKYLSDTGECPPGAFETFSPGEQRGRERSRRNSLSEEFMTK